MAFKSKAEVWIMIAIIDYKAGNLTSVVKALTYLNAPEIAVTQDPDLVRKAAKIVLPGVGHFQATQLLTDLGLTQAVRESVARGTWFLGVCVGMQWLFEGSTEATATPGLSHFAGLCEHFPTQYEGAALKSPHVGWNSLEDIRSGSFEGSRLFRNISPGGFVYYTHSWRAPIVKATAAVTHYGGPFTAAVGLQVLQNFIEM